MLLEALNVFRLVLIVVSGFILFRAFHQKVPDRLAGKGLLIAGWGLLSLNLLVGAIFHSSWLPENWISYFYGPIGILTGRVGQPLGLLFLIMGGLRLARSLSEQFQWKYATLVENALVGVYIIQDGKIVYANPKIAQIFGYTQEELLGKEVRALVAPEDWETVQHNVRRRLRGEIEALHYEFIAVRKNGERFVAEVYGGITLHNGKPAIQGTLVDVTEQRRMMEALQASERRYRQLIEKSPEAIAVYSDNTIIFVNRAGMRVLGARRPEEVVGKSIYEFLAPESLSSGEEPFLSQEKPGKYAGPIRRTLQTLEGKKIIVEMVALAMEFDGQAAVYLIGRDITQQVQAEEKEKQRELQVRQQNQVLFQLSTSPELWQGNLEAFFRKVTEQNAVTLGVSQVGIWLFSPCKEFLELRDQYETESDSHRCGSRLRAVDYPAYFQALEESRVIDAHLAAEDPRTREFRESYLAPQNIQSMLDAPIRLDGKTVGVICHEQVGTPRHWNLEEQNFAAAVADLLSLALEIVHRREAEEALRESESKYRQLFEMATDAILLLDSDRIQQANQAACLMFDSSPEEILKHSFLDFAPPFQQDHRRSDVKFQELQKRALEGEICYFEWTCTRPGRKVFYTEVSLGRIRLNDSWKLIAMVRDVSDRVLSEQALRESEKRYRSLFESVPVGLYRSTPDGRIIDANKAMLYMLRFPSKQALLNFPAEKLYVDPEDRQRWKKLVEKKNVVQDFITRFRCFDGSMIWVRENARVLRDGSGEPVAYYGSLENITEKVMAEQALAAEKERLRITLQSIGDGVIATDTRGNIQIMNPVAEELTGHSFVKARGHFLGHVFALLSEEGVALPEITPEIFAHTEQIARLNGTFQLRAANGTRRYILCTSAPIMDKEKGLIGSVLVFRDITQQRRMEEELLKAEKLESLSILAGGIAHDFNNILTAILGNISLMKMKLQPEDALTQVVENAEKAALRARDLTQQLLTFAKGGMPVKKVTSLGQLIRETLRFVLHGSSVKAETEIPSDLWNALADEGQLSQVLHNLIINAIQAMPEGGTIKVQAENLILNQPHQEHGVTIAPGRYVRLSIADQGVGIAPEHLPKIFDPYFTTKEKGSGLGLASTYSIIRKHDGYITVSSQLGKGTTFRVYLPAAESKPSRERSAALQQEYPRLAGRVLIMDDEEPIRDLVSLILREKGLQVTAVADGEEAVEHFDRALAEGKPFDLVILDLTIPGGMGGREALAQIRKLDPDVLAIVSSGYNNDPILGNFERFGFNRCVSKPFRVQELLDAVFGLLQQKQRAPASAQAAESKQNNGKGVLL